MSTPDRPTPRRLVGQIEGLPATLDVLDYGGADHVGVLHADGRQARATLRNWSFTPRKRAGRPTREARDVAVFLASLCFERQGTPKVAESVVGLWCKRGFRGLSEAAHVRAARKRAEKLLGQGAAVIFNAEGAGWFAPDAKIDAAGGHGPAWVWNHGDEEAQYGILTIRKR